MIADIIGFTGDGGGKGHRNFLPGVLAGDGDGAIPAGHGLWNGLQANEFDSAGDRRGGFAPVAVAARCC